MAGALSHNRVNAKKNAARKSLARARNMPDGANQVCILTSTAERKAAIEFAKAAAMRPRIVGEALNQVAADPEVEGAMFELLEIQKIVESKARITSIPEKGGILPELVASSSRSPKSPTPLRPTGKATVQT